MKKRFLNMLAAISIAAPLAFIACSTSDEVLTFPETTSMTLNTTSVSVFEGFTNKVNVTTVPNLASVKWGESSNPGVATVSQYGLITGIAPGNATVTVTSGAMQETVNIRVRPAPTFMYVAGYTRNSSGVDQPRLYRCYVDDEAANPADEFVSEAIDLPTFRNASAAQYNAYANAVFVDENKNVYVAGNEFGGAEQTGYFAGCYWINGVRTTFDIRKNDPNSISTSYIQTAAFAIHASGGDVYVGGTGYYYTYAGLGGWAHCATLWVNGKYYILNAPTDRASGQNGIVYSVTVSGNNIYAAGVKGDGSRARAVLWTIPKSVLGNSEAIYSSITTTYLPDSGGDSYANSVKVSQGGEVHVFGYEGTNPPYKPCHWIGTTTSATITTNYSDSNVWGGTYSGTSSYMIGYQYTGSRYNAVYWRNDTPQTPLTDPANPTASFVGRDITVLGDRIFATGYSIGEEDTNWYVWINGRAYPIAATRRELDAKGRAFPSLASRPGGFNMPASVTGVNLSPLITPSDTNTTHNQGFTSAPLSMFVLPGGN